MATIRTLLKNAATILVLASFLILACKEEPNMEEAFDKSLLFNKWYLQSGIIVENGLKRPLTIDSCKQDDFTQLKTENKLVFYFGNKKCNPQEPDTLYRYWHIIDGQLDLDNVFYDVISVTPDSMNLRRKLSSGLGEYTTIAYYYLH
ncbi:MAG: hypothetical protein K9J37_21190 [Saprospiraceae bacterium]|nr:hypothetical protein [Saprospiraceae bacterium]MCF8252436.1 hypothetical protein [Saprospiraceae bacterium]MCF8282283.1 hypothetical protein [Bacteroidales bacterium]MCF8314038.1 hypothetical protein [Saprospiraceae bacterium]MCF8442766.1 hypothetical protein [Saprospiraceae bacterium]